MATRLAPVAPALPLAAQDYDPRNIEQILRALRLYFRQLDITNQTTITDITALQTDLIPARGSFYDTTTQTAAVASTAYAMTFNSTDATATSGTHIGVPTSRVYVTTAGVYNIQFSAQFLSTSGSTHLVYVWLRINGTNVPYSSTKVTIQGNNTAVVAAWNFLATLNAGDYFELMWESNDAQVEILAEAGTAVHPAIPSIILTVTKATN